MLARQEGSYVFGKSSGGLGIRGADIFRISWQGVFVPIPIPFNPVSHIENRRLLDAAYGTVRLESRERVHIHECHVCQGVFYLFVIQDRGVQLPPQEKAG
jgi:hypothetical protein